MTVKLYERDSYLRTFEAVVTDCQAVEDGFEVVLDRTAFFPEGGGQGADSGLIQEVCVMDVQERDGIIYHKTDRAICVGTRVQGAIDWNKRFDRMQQHSGEHIVSGIVHNRFGYDNVGFHLGDEIVTMDFNGEITPDMLSELEIEANKAVYTNRRIIVSYPDEEAIKSLNYRSKIEIEGQVRIVTVEGIDVCACCAPHVNQTGEIGCIKIISCQKYKGGVRMAIACGMRALNDYQLKQNQISSMSVLLSAKTDQVAAAVEKVYQEMQDLRYEVNGLRNDLMMARLSSLDGQKGHVCLFVAHTESGPMRKAVNALMEERDTLCGLFDGNDEAGYKFLIGSSKGQAKDALEQLKQHFVCRGGGSPQMVQGQITGTQEAIESVFKGLYGQE